MAGITYNICMQPSWQLTKRHTCTVAVYPVDKCLECLTRTEIRDSRMCTWSKNVGVQSGCHQSARNPTCSALHYKLGYSKARSSAPRQLGNSMVPGTLCHPRNGNFMMWHSRYIYSNDNLASKFCWCAVCHNQWRPLFVIVESNTGALPLFGNVNFVFASYIWGDRLQLSRHDATCMPNLISADRVQLSWQLHWQVAVELTDPSSVKHDAAELTGCSWADMLQPTRHVASELTAELPCCSWSCA